MNSGNPGAVRDTRVACWFGFARGSARALTVGLLNRYRRMEGLKEHEQEVWPVFKIQLRDGKRTRRKIRNLWPKNRTGDQRKIRLEWENSPHLTCR
jgi:hypothetical protein